MENNFKYWEGKKYEEQTKIMFEKPVKILLGDLDEFLEQYKPFHCSDVYLVEEFDYGEYDNKVTAIVESKTISPKFSHYYSKPIGIFEAGDTAYSIRTAFWYESKDKPFWNTMPKIGYDNKTHIAKNINELEIEVQGVYVISWVEKDKIEREYKNANS